MAAPLGFVGIEAGWVVTEVGRQPWIIDHVMRTAESVTPMPGLWIPMSTFTLLYLMLAGVVVWALWRHIAATEEESVSGKPSRLSTGLST
jgi:cytochrome d ubiquinol oxidase subunit I